MRERKNLRNRREGFTLIELLVVTTIILVLTAITTVFYQAAQRKSRDNKRKVDLEQVRSALEVYRSENDTYPTDANWASMISTLTSGNYISSTPTDPRSYSYYYNTSDGGITYTLCSYLEVPGSSPPDCGANCGTAPGNCNYQVTNP